LSDETPTELPQSLGRDLQREDFTAERLQLLAQATLRNGEQAFISDVERAESLQAIRDAIPPGEDAWVFGYGSLMWNPAIKVAESRPARIKGYHAYFCLSLKMGRGSPEKPGLMLGLDEGSGECLGVAHRIAASEIDGELAILWFREMFSGAYTPRWVDAEIEGAGTRRAIAFVINKAHPRYEGLLDEAIIAERIAASEGFLGTNRDYLYRTIERLSEMGMADGPLHRIASRVREIAKEGSQT
jgi:cation transport protein ChaC